jgi:hypothetical protein
MIEDFRIELIQMRQTPVDTWGCPKKDFVVPVLRST